MIKLFYWEGANPKNPLLLKKKILELKDQAGGLWLKLSVKVLHLVLFYRLKPKLNKTL
jgi:hypothetical protein